MHRGMSPIDNALRDYNRFVVRYLPGKAGVTSIGMPNRLPIPTITVSPGEVVDEFIKQHPEHAEWREHLLADADDKYIFAAATWRKPK